jgi:ATP-dependent helicase/nuclease subunit B
LLELSSEILAHLQSGGTLLVPSRQRASAVRFAFSGAMLAEGRRLWSSPDVLPWNAWLERELDDARARGEGLPRRLTSTEEWLLWQEAVLEACAGFGILMPDGMIEPVRRAVSLLDDYALNLSGAATAEAPVLGQSMLHFRRRCGELGVLSRSSWRELAACVRPSQRLLVADSASLGPERARWLRQHGARFATPEGDSGTCRVVEYETPTQEADAAADWCAGQLANDALARLLIVVPRLNETRHLWERAFSQRLDQALILAGRDSSAESGFAIEGGRSLTNYPLVAAALHLIAVSAGAAGFNELSFVLRSPYHSISSRSDSLAIDRWLREHSIADLRLLSAPAIPPLLTRELGEAAAAAVSRLLQLLGALNRANSATPAVWAEGWATLLRQCGWPGVAPLSSDEQQTRVRFDELLGDFAGVLVPARRLTLPEAAARLQTMAQRVAFEPDSGDVPVTISARLEDPIVRYDAIWVAGLSSDVWPPPAQPDPLLPLPMQFAAHMLPASAEGQSALAQQLQQRWLHSARECVFSWSRTSEDLPRDRSPLLAPSLIADPVPLAAAPGNAVSLESWCAARAPVLEAWGEQTRPATLVGGTLPGGVRLLELQSLCPFRAFAELRLQATPLEQPAPGINPRVRGMILHQALELFWGEMRDQATLQACSADRVQVLVDRSVERAVRETLEREPGSVSEQVRRHEYARTTRLIARMLEWEARRSPFFTTILEAPRRHEFAGAALELRLDRVDQLDDGRLLIIDYKSGSPKPFDGLAERLKQPQLPAYAIAAGADTAAVATLYVGRERVKVSGSADHSRRLRYLNGPKPGEPTWVQRVERWKRQLQQLVDEYLRGDAAVQPLPDACKFCHLHALCRIDPATLAVLDTDPDNPDGEEPDEDEQEEDSE